MVSLFKILVVDRDIVLSWRKTSLKDELQDKNHDKRHFFDLLKMFRHSGNVKIYDRYNAQDLVQVVRRFDSMRVERK